MLIGDSGAFQTVQADIQRKVAARSFGLAQSLRHAQSPLGSKLKPRCAYGDVACLAECRIERDGTADAVLYGAGELLSFRVQAAIGVPHVGIHDVALSRLYPQIFQPFLPGGEAHQSPRRFVGSEIWL